MKTSYLDERSDQLDAPARASST